MSDIYPDNNRDAPSTEGFLVADFQGDTKESRELTTEGSMQYRSYIPTYVRPIRPNLSI
jgi:hypothetical protein